MFCGWGKWLNTRNLKLTGVLFVFCRFRMLVKHYDGISLTQKSIQNTANTVLPGGKVSKSCKSSIADKE